MRYKQIPRPPAERYSQAERYVAGQPLGPLREIAREVDPDATVAEVNTLGILVVRYLRSSDDHPPKLDYVIVEDGDYLVYGEDFDVLYANDARSFQREHEVGP